MRRIFFLLLFAALLPFLIGAPRGGKKQDAWDIWRQGYETFTRAESLRERGDYTRALSTFKESLECYREIKKTRSDWDQSIIDRRIADCEKAIAAVEKLIQPEKPVETPKEPEKKVETPAEKEEAGFRKRYFDTKAELDELKKENERNKTAATTIPTLLRDLQESREKITLQEQQIKALEIKLKEPDAGVTALRAQLLEGKLNFENLTKKLQLAETQKEKLEKEIPALTREKNLALNEAKKQTEATTRTLRELEELRRFQQESVKRIEAEQKAQKESADKLKTAEGKLAENEKELAALNKRLADTIKEGGDSLTLNSELLDENRKLKETIKTNEESTEKSGTLVSALQEQHRQTQLEITRLQEAVKTLQGAKEMIEKHAGELTRELEKGKAGTELTSVELKNLRERNLKLETDLKGAADRSTKLEETLKTRDSDAFKSVAASTEARKKLAEEIDSLKKKLTAGEAEAKTRKTEYEKREQELKAELVQNKSALMQAEEKQKNTEAEQKILNTNFQALRKEFESSRTAAKELEESRKRLAELEKLPPRLLEEQKGNQRFSEELANLKRELQQEKKRLSGEVALLREQLAQKQKDDPNYSRELALLRKQLHDEKMEKEKLNRELARRPTEIVPLPPVTDVTTIPWVPASPSKAVPLNAKPAELLAAGRKAEAEESRELAIWNYQAVLALDPENFEAAVLLGNLFLRDEEYAKAEELLTLASNQRPEETILALARAEALIGLGKCGNAMVVLEKPLARHPNDYRIQLAVARALAGSGQPLLARKKCLELIQKNPEAPEPRVELARITSGSDKRQAAEYYSQARRLGARPDVELEKELGGLLDEKRELAAFMNKAATEAVLGGDWESALWYYRQLAEIDRENPSVPLRIALACFKTGAFAEARKELETQPESPERSLLRVMQELYENRTPEAEALAKTTLDKNSGNPLVLTPGWPELKLEYAALLKTKAFPRESGSVFAALLAP